MIPAEVLAQLATRASTLEERLVPPFAPVAANDAGRIEACIDRWAELGAKGDRERLQRSLHWRGIDLDRIRPAFGGVSLPPEGALPGWVQRFAVLLETALNEHRQNNADAPPENERSAVMTCFVRAAAAELRRVLPAAARAIVADSALTAMERHLLLRLTRIAGTVLAREYFFYSSRDSRNGGNPENRAQRFADRMLQPPIPDFLAEYPVLARLLTLACDNWQAAALELLGRLAEDRDAIMQRFHQGGDSGLLVDIQVGDADVHDGHREVVILVFEDSFRAVYKPRSLSLDQAFHGLVRWFNERGLSPSLRSPAVLCRAGYGWAEFIAYRPADGAAELREFYERAGALACVAYVMGASDLHYGNVIAQGGYPMVIDLETLLSAEPRKGALPFPAARMLNAHPGAGRTVLQSLLLPLTHRVPTGVFTDLSALGAEPRDDAARQGCDWLPVRQTPITQVLRDHAPVIEAGFVSAYRFIERHREALLSTCGPLAAFERCPIRVVLRDTALYFQLLRQSIDPAVLHDGIDRRIALERLNHVLAIADSPPSFVSIVTREQSALWGLDVPRFLVMTDETDLRDAAGLVATEVMARTPLEETRLRIRAMSEPDLQRQRSDIRYALSGHAAGRSGTPGGNLPSSTLAKLPDSAMLIAAAERLGADLLDEADSWGGGQPPWRGLIFLHAAGRFTVGDAGAGFADGGLGIALLFAALFRVTGNPKWRAAAFDLSMRYLTPLANPAAYRGHVAGGITAGVGGLLYGGALVAALIESEEVLSHGLALARALGERSIDEESDVSLGDGLAGSLLGVASLRCMDPGGGLDEIAARGGARLRRAKPLAAPGLLSGHAGLVLAAETIGLKGDFPVPDKVPTEGAIDWAEGAIGQSLAALKTDSRANHALSFLQSFSSVPAAADDSFAFGTAGEVDALTWAADRSGRPEFRYLALQRAAEAAERAYQGKPRLLGGMLGEGLRIPGLLHGSAGIGYALLRLASPGRLPALAVFELPSAQKVA